MVTLIIGGSGSGKSAYAEEYITMLSEENRKYYIATMQVFDKEGQAKIERHRSMRAEKGFWTIEQPVSIEKALDKMIKLEKNENTALLECISNLTANEMFSGKAPEKREVVVKKVVDGVKRLCEDLKHLVIVTNNVFEDGISYDESTMEYIRVMGSINEQLADFSDKVIEVVVGIPVLIKG